MIFALLLRAGVRRPQIAGTGPTLSYFAGVQAGVPASGLGTVPTVVARLTWMVSSVDDTNYELVLSGPRSLLGLNTSLPPGELAVLPCSATTVDTVIGFGATAGGAANRVQGSYHYTLAVRRKADGGIVSTRVTTVPVAMGTD